MVFDERFLFIRNFCKAQLYLSISFKSPLEYQITKENTYSTRLKVCCWGNHDLNYNLVFLNIKTLKNILDSCAHLIILCKLSVKKQNKQLVCFRAFLVLAFDLDKNRLSDLSLAWHSLSYFRISWGKNPK